AMVSHLQVVVDTIEHDLRECQPVSTRIKLVQDALRRRKNQLLTASLACEAAVVAKEEAEDQVQHVEELLKRLFAPQLSEAQAEFPHHEEFAPMHAGDPRAGDIDAAPNVQ
ncbi:MAG: hypothetical protein ACKPKO_20025, partial [Candidatus Fonsibacter sp.]